MDSVINVLIVRAADLHLSSCFLRLSLLICYFASSNNRQEFKTETFRKLWPMEKVSTAWYFRHLFSNRSVPNHFWLQFHHSMWTQHQSAQTPHPHARVYQRASTPPSSVLSLQLISQLPSRLSYHPPPPCCPSQITRWETAAVKAWQSRNSASGDVWVPDFRQLLTEKINN